MPSRTQLTARLYLLAFVCSLFAIGMIVIFTPHCIGMVQARDWRETTGEVTAEKYEKKGHADTRHYRSGDTYVTLTYKYTVDGHEYLSSNIWPATGALAGEDRPNRPFGSRYQVGQEVAVYYDPDDPSLAALLLRNQKMIHDFRWGMILLLPIPIYVYG